jgi:hypothetical protein
MIVPTSVGADRRWAPRLIDKHAAMGASPNENTFRVRNRQNSRKPVIQIEWPGGEKAKQGSKS